MGDASFGSTSTSFNYISDYINDRFNSEVDNFSRYKQRRTGFPNIDEKHFLYPGLYTLGGISSIGKTTFVHQFADQLAEMGCHVLYFSLEQNTLELISKSLTRRIFQQSKIDQSYKLFSAMDIRLGLASASREFNEQLQAYKKAVENRMCVIECNMSITIEDIVRYVQEYMKSNINISPIVFIDYLQIIKSSDIGGRTLIDQKANIDHVIHTLKAFQMHTNITIIIVASLNRANYQTAISFEAFKESGGIEYASDCIWGLQLSVLENESYNFVIDSKTKKRRITSSEEKNQIINEEKGKQRRNIELVALKNRSGVSYYKVYFEYQPEYEIFLPLDEKGKPYD